MFYLIGLGLKPEQLTVEAISALKKCDEVFMERYTSDFSTGELEELEALAGKKIKELDRPEVETGFSKRLAVAREKNIALLVIGNPLFATTHVQLLIDAERLGVQWSVVPGISVQNYIGKTGLNAYRFGRVVSIVSPSENYKPESFYDNIKSNLEAGLHTLCLLDISPMKKMTPRDAHRLLLEIESKRNSKALKEAKIVVLAALGSEEERIASGKATKLLWEEFTMPASIIVCAELSEKEKEGLAELTEEVL